ncbi:DUF488 domain-containing protein [Nocardia rhizosphaerae]|uniref:DUF488 domain-containing protein n=1 Tax=Nocardia rhizosphaerae TaxID=1691571 RepID=A0ABV8L4T8_9NOCA
MTPDFEVKRIYEPPTADDGTRVLVDRLWPRGTSKAEAHIDLWPKQITPSTTLRQWLHADRSAREPEFAERFRAELAAPEAQRELDRLRALAGRGRVTLLTAVKEADLPNSHIPVLLDELRERHQNAAG